MFAVFIVVASAQQDDGSYRPEHHGGECNHQDVKYQHNSGKYVHSSPVVNIIPQYVVPQYSVPQYAPVAIPSAAPVTAQLATPAAAQFGALVATQFSSPDAAQFAAPVAAQLVAPVGRFSNNRQWQILRHTSEQASNDYYRYNFDTENGIHAWEQSEIEPPNTKKSNGFYEYTSPEGQLIRVDYTADENG